MKLKKIGIGIIGCGKAGKYHAYWYSKNPDCKLVGFYNRTENKAKELANQYYSDFYKNWKDMIRDPNIDVVSICTPVFQHKDQTIFALKYKKHVLCEKPMACTSKECENMIKISEDNQVNLGVFFNMRFNPVVETINKNITKLGKIISIDMSFQFNRSDLGWRGVKNIGTGVLKELGTHAFDLAINWFGEIKRVKAEIGRFKNNSDCDDHGFVICRFNSGTIGKFYISYNDPSFYDELVEGLVGQILGERGKICFLLNSYDPEKNRVFYVKDNNKKEIAIKKSKDYDYIYPGHMDSFGKLINKFINDVIEKKKFEPSGLDGLKTIKLVESAIKSSGGEL